MGNFSRDTFDKLKHYVGVRLQQGVPIVDADWNEMEDIRRYELEAFLKWYVGNGVPKGNDGFRILPFPNITDPGPGPGPQPEPQLAIQPSKLQPAGSQLNNFLIFGGENNPEGIGRCLVEGWDVIIHKTLAYRTQPLFNNPDLAKKWGVSPLSPLTTPQNANRMDVVYLDVWEREVNAQEDGNIVNERIGIETCVRRKREWVVRVLEGTEGSATVPQLPSPQQGHVHYRLASLTRKAKDAVIDETDIADLRLTGLSVPSYHDIQQITADAFGSGYSLDHDGRPNLKLSLRDAINALLRGELPSTPEMKIADSVINKPVFLEDGNGDVWCFWMTNKSGNSDIWYKRYVPATATWGPDTLLTGDTGIDAYPSVVADKNGDVWAFWISSRSGNNEIWYKRYTLATAAWGNDTQLTNNAANDYSVFALVDSGGDVWIFWTSTRTGNSDIWCKRHATATATWGSDTQLTNNAGSDSLAFAVADDNGDVWLFWSSYRSGNNDIWYKRYMPATATWGNDMQLTNDAETELSLFALADNNGDVWVFWNSLKNGNFDIWYKRYSRATADWSSDDMQLTKDTSVDSTPVALADNNGDVWVFWLSNRDGMLNLWHKRYIRSTGSWSTDTPMTTGAIKSYGISALQDSHGNIWVFWTRLLPKTRQHETLCRKLIPVI